MGLSPIAARAPRNTFRNCETPDAQATLASRLRAQHCPYFAPVHAPFSAKPRRPCLILATFPSRHAWQNRQTQAPLPTLDLLDKMNPDAAQGAIGRCTGCNMATPSPEAGWIVTLVHGTWGRGFFSSDKPGKPPRWFEDGSKFRHEFAQELEALHIPFAKIEVCNWSGANSIVARERAARQLASQLTAQRSLNPGALQLVIAHSHGGNIAVRALAHLDDTESKLLIATLATPFLEMFRHTQEHLSFSWIFRLVCLFLVSCAASYYLIVQHRLPSSFYTLYFWIMIIPIGLLNGLEEKRRRFRAAPWGKVLVRYTSHVGLQKGLAELLILRGVDDEAALSIAAGALGRRLASMNASFSQAAMGYMFGILIFGIIFLMIHWFFLRPFMDYYIDQYLMPGFGIISGVMAAAIIAYVISSVASAMCLAVFGRELFLSFYNPQISTNSVPDAPGSVSVQTLVRKRTVPSAGFRHALYNEPGCAAHIVNWARSRVAGEPYVPPLGNDRLQVDTLDLQQERREPKLPEWHSSTRRAHTHGSRPHNARKRSCRERSPIVSSRHWSRQIHQST